VTTDHDALVQPLVWIDLEMTGLDPDRDLIVEIATIVTDGSLERIVEGPDLVIAAPEESLDVMDPVVVGMHESSGLLPLIRASQLSVAEAEQQTMDFLRAHVPDPGLAPLAGNSVHADRAFLRRYMPELEAWMHYRNVDVSTFKEVARRWAPDLMRRAPLKNGAHRALADIRESIEELRFYRDALFRRGEPGQEPDTSPEG
jgi:oligoribonuclease